jgi:hypothetical protein
VKTWLQIQVESIPEFIQEHTEWKKFGFKVNAKHHYYNEDRIYNVCRMFWDIIYLSDRFGLNKIEDCLKMSGHIKRSDKNELNRMNKFSKKCADADILCFAQIIQHYDILKNAASLRFSK